jgi:pyruvate/2-oxoacid:ferredoxin oxidoreductase beta subunit
VACHGYSYVPVGSTCHSHRKNKNLKGMRERERERERGENDVFNLKSKMKKRRENICS